MMNTPVVSERRARWTWTFIIVGLLGSQLSIGVAAVILANQDSSQQIIPDYYKRSMAWDTSVATQQASDTLGWKATINVAEDADVTGARTITLVLTDRTGAPVTGATGSLQIYHHRKIADVIQAEWSELSSGIYRATARLDQKGLWQFTVAMHRGDEEQFVTEQELELTGVKTVGATP